jgi:hypothetical protein
MRFLNETVVSAVSVPSNSQSSEVDSSYMTNVSAQGIFSGTAAGTLKLQTSNDKPKAPNLSTVTFTVTNWTDIPNASVSVSGSGSYLIPKTDLCNQYIRSAFVSTATGVQNITAVADVASSLNSKYFLLTAGTADGGTAYYVWYDVDGGGVDPALPGKTGVPVAISAGDSANTVAGNTRTALGAVADFVITGATSHIIITNASAGPFTPASDGTAATGFSFSVTTPTGTMTVNLKSVGF